MMQRRYCAFAAEQKGSFLVHAALKQRHLHSPPLLRGDQLKPRAGMEMSCISYEI